MSLEQRLATLFAPLTYQDVSYKIHAVETDYPTHRKVFIFHTPIEKIVNGVELVNKKSKLKPGKQKEEDIDDSLRKTKSKIRDIVLCNDFELFATFTFKNSRQDVDKCKDRMSYWLKNQQKRKGKFEYLIIPEFHKDKESLHFHALLKDYRGDLIDSGKKTKRKQEVYNFKSYTHGFNTAVKINSEEIGKVGSYVCKYITKEMPLFFGKNRYWRSLNLKKPIVIENPSPWYLKEAPFWVNENKYGITLLFDRKTA
jgi:hypothetical protein